MYMHIFDNKFFTFPFYPSKKKKWKALKRGNMRLLWDKK
jgi:hypothetical protein